MEKQIVIAHRGWVFIGNVVATDSEVKIENAKNLRRWGTTKGLGQLASDGPQDGTVCDDYGTVTIHPLAVVARINVTSEKWQL